MMHILTKVSAFLLPYATDKVGQITISLHGGTRIFTLELLPAQLGKSLKFTIEHPELAVVTIFCR